MRCPTCGTENVPDSRFCGACGAKLTPVSVSRVAPTAKIPDDAPFPAGPMGPPSQPPHNNYQAGPASIPPQNNHASGYIAPQYGTGPASIPPRAPVEHRPASIPPQNQHAPSISMPVPAQPRWGLIAFLLILDLGLAGAGGFLLWKGLAKAETPPPPVEDKRAVAPPAPRAEVTPAPPPPNLAASVNAIAQEEPATVAPAPPKKAAPVAKAKASRPEDPYDPKASLAAEIELAASRSRDAFAACRAGGDLHGRIDVQFTVQTDGSVQGVKVTQNTTHDDRVATCIMATIRPWSFASHPANPTDIVRPFIYN